jgi:hypothetical protein
MIHALAELLEEAMEKLHHGHKADPPPHTHTPNKITSLKREDDSLYMVQEELDKFLSTLVECDRHDE